MLRDPDFRCCVDSRRLSLTQQDQGWDIYHKDEADAAVDVVRELASSSSSQTSESRSCCQWQVFCLCICVEVGYVRSAPVQIPLHDPADLECRWRCSSHRSRHHRQIDPVWVSESSTHSFGRPRWGFWRLSHWGVYVNLVRWRHPECYSEYSWLRL